MAKSRFSSTDSYSALLPDTLDAPQGSTTVPVALVRSNPHQFRQHIDPAKIQELAASISAHGLANPPLLRPVGEGYYEVVAGERRFRALQLLDWTDMPATVRDMTDYQAAMIMAAENFSREDLTLQDELLTYERLANDPETGEILSDRELGRRLNRDYNRISRLRRLGRYPDLMRDVQDGLLTMTAALDQISRDEGRAKLREDAGLTATSKEEMLQNREAAGLDPTVDDDGYGTDAEGAARREADFNRNLGKAQAEADNAVQGGIFTSDSVSKAKSTQPVGTVGWSALTKALNLIGGLWDHEEEINPALLDEPARKHFIDQCNTAKQNLDTIITVLQQEG